MAPANQKPQQKKRTRKRKRRVASSSSSSSDSESDSSSSSATSAPVVRRQIPPKPLVQQASKDSSDSEESSSSDSSDASSSSSSSTAPVRAKPSAAPEVRSRERSPSPPPTTNAIPPFLSPEDPSQGDAVLRARFKKFWMASVADAFKNDLEELRKVRLPKPIVGIVMLIFDLGTIHDEVETRNSN